MSASGSALPEEVFWEAILANQLLRYPLLQVADLYKLAFQAARGGEHAMGDPGAARAWLEDEIAGLEPDNSPTIPAEPEIDPISPDGDVLRVHLRPFLAGGGDAEHLLRAFVSSANAGYGSLEKLAAFWSWSLELAVQGFLPFDPQSLEAFFEGMRAEGFPAAHHSPVYERSYRPAYRVVLAKYLP